MHDRFRYYRFTPNSPIRTHRQITRRILKKYLRVAFSLPAETRQITADGIRPW